MGGQAEPHQYACDASQLPGLAYGHEVWQLQQLEDQAEPHQSAHHVSQLLGLACGREAGHMQQLGGQAEPHQSALHATQLPGHAGYSQLSVNPIWRTSDYQTEPLQYGSPQDLDCYHGQVQGVPELCGGRQDLPQLHGGRQHPQQAACWNNIVPVLGNMEDYWEN